jgi:hypothetical protein
MMFLHERLQWPQVAGAAIVLASAVAIGRARRQPVAVPEGEVLEELTPPTSTRTPPR